MKSILFLSLGYFVVLFLLLAGLYMLVSGHSTALCGLVSFEGSSNFHCLFPFQYIAVGSLGTALLLAIWHAYFYRASWMKKYTSFLLLIPLAMLLDSVLGGILWATHSIITEHSWRGMHPVQYYFFMILRSIHYGWIVIVRSFPFNLLAIVVSGIGVFTTSRAMEVWWPTPSESRPRDRGHKS